MSSSGFSIRLDENGVETVIVFLVGLSGLCTGVYAVVIIRRCSYLKGIVEHYCLLDVLGTTTINACHLIWAVPSNLWLIDQGLPFGSTIFGTLAFAAVPLVMICKILLGLNRYFSVSFRGLFYRYLEDYQRIQYILLIGYPTLATLPLFHPGCSVTYTRESVPMFYSPGTCGTTYVNYVQIYFGYVEMVLSGFLDVATFLLIRKRMKELHMQQARNSSRERRDLKKQLRLATQMLATMIGTVLMNLTTTIGQFYVQTDFHLFLLFTCSWQTLCCLNGLIYIIFQWEPPQKRSIAATATGRNSSISDVRTEFRRKSRMFQ